MEVKFKRVGIRLLQLLEISVVIYLIMRYA